jgi:hypothetical protein
MVTNENFGTDVQLVTHMLGAWLERMPEDERRAEIEGLMRHMGEGRPIGAEPES